MSATRWLSLDFSELVARQAKKPEIFDVLIIGSGYGGAIAAAELAGCTKEGEPITVCVLERGKEYLPGMFPSRMSELPTHLRFSLPGANVPSRAREGLFDLRLGADVSVIVANGLGGGSLINAGVMEIPRDEVFNSPRWPRALRDAATLRPFVMAAKERLGAMNGGKDNTIADHPDQSSNPIKKHAAFQRLAKDQFRPAALTIAMKDRTSPAGVEFKACKRCGDCATGCNHRAKESLDTNLLVEARRHGAEIYCGVTVLRIDRDSEDGPWVIHATYTDELLSQRHGRPVRLRARRVILAAGTLGSTEILLRSQQASKTLRFSALLGRHFSTNGDMMAAGYGQKHEVNAIADENQAPAERNVGPSITGVIKLEGKTRDGAYKTPLVLQEIGGPGPLKLAFEEPFTTARMLHWLGEKDLTCHSHEHPKHDPFAVDPSAIAHTQVYAAMGDDGADGVLRLQPQPETLLSDGAIRVDWPGINKHPLFEAQINTLEQLAKDAGLGGVTIANPMWQLLPGRMQELINNQRGPLLTVHPLGGCPMGDDVAHGVVDEYGQVFDGRPGSARGAKYKDLLVLDGAIVPSALGTNPALTIAALALRAIGEKLRNDWKFGAPAPADKLPPRPRFRDPEQEFINPPEPVATTCEFTERLFGEVCLRTGDGKLRTYVAVLTLHYDDKLLRDLFSVNPHDGALITPVLSLYDTEDRKHARNSTLRLYACETWQELAERNCTNEQREAALEHEALLTAQVRGTLTILKREASTALFRGASAFWAWLRNRGTRDLYQLLLHKLSTPKSTAAGGGERDGPLDILVNFLKLATHAGEVRLFEYDLKLQPKLKVKLGFVLPAGAGGMHNLRGVKRITYARPSNPWRQLMEMSIESMPGLHKTPKTGILALDNRYMANRSIPLFRIVSERDGVAALTDLASLAAYLGRMLVGIHLWNARLPEPPTAQPPDRLPRRLPGLPEPEIQELAVDRLEGRPVHVRLTRYRGKTPDAIPVVMFHGYSASGTTFAHPALRTDIARFLHEKGRDVWIVDTRTSTGMPTATYPWTFEAVALKDIPAAVDHIFRTTGQKMDVIAHCMGAAMFSMAVLSAERPSEEITTAWDKGFSDDFYTERSALPDRIRRVVLSQVGPLMVLSPRNIFSAYVTSYLRYFLPVENYRFRPSAEPGLAEQILDRALATLPYPDEELKLENPSWPPWRRTEFVGSRHRIDALYGRCFSLANLEPGALEHIDDLFGPLNAETVSQVLHFTRLLMITNRFGRNVFVSRKSLQDHWKFPTLGIHGVDNGLTDIATLERMRDVMADAGRDFTPVAIRNFGHQDCWIGKDASKVFEEVWFFLRQETEPPANRTPDLRDARHAPPPPSAPTQPGPLMAQVPWGGPVLGHQAAAAVPISLSGEPGLGRPSCIVALPVAREAGSDEPRWQVIERGRRLPVGSAIPLTAMKIIGTQATTPDWFSVSVPAHFFAAPADGVLVLAIYAQSKALSRAGWYQPAFNPISAAAGRTPPPSLLHEFDLMPLQIASTVRYLLKNTAAVELETGLVEYPVSSVIAIPPPTTPPIAALMQHSAHVASKEASGKKEKGGELRLALGSCQYPAGLLDSVPCFAAYERLRLSLDSGWKARALVLTGDQIYVDATAGLFDPTQRDDQYRRLYERWLSQEPVKQVLRRLPLIAVPDDHEICENWEPISRRFHPQQAYGYDKALKEGRKHYCHYLRQPEQLSETAPLWRTYELQRIPLFLADTRTERSRRTARSIGAARIMSREQFRALTSWLESAPKTLPKLIVSPALMLPRHTRAAAHDFLHAGATHALRSDGWDGYPCSMHALLGYIAKNRIRNVVFLSGDEHLGMATRARLTPENGDEEDAVWVHSIHTSALYAPYPFVNAIPEDLLGDETFKFSSGTAHYACKVETSFYPGAGFTLLDFIEQGGVWKLRCEFERGPGNYATSTQFALS